MADEHASSHGAETWTDSLKKGFRMSQFRMQNFCTLFDRNYISRGLALYESLRAASEDNVLTILCLDSATKQAILGLDLPSVDLVTVETLEAWDPGLAHARANRTRVEYYFTCKPVLMAYVLQHSQSPSRVTYLDSDLFYFSPPTALDAELAGTSVALTPHRFPLNLYERRKYGEFNAGWVSAAADSEGREFLKWWRDRCIDWCQMTVEPDRFADQKYLDRVPSMFFRAHALVHPGANVAPWNLATHSLRERDGRPMIDDQPLIFFHFHGLRKILGNLYDSGLLEYGLTLTPELRTNIFRPYVESIERWERRLREEVSGWQIVTDRPSGIRAAARRWKRALTVIAGRAALSVPRRVESSQFRGPNDS